MRSTFREYGLPALLLAASVVTTTANGARFMQNFLEGMPPVVRDADLWPWAWLSDHPDLYITGWAFSFSLLGILLIHEFGHYFACRAHRIRATLPWILPAPTLSGTAGAVIRIRSRITSRNALMDVGIYGPARRLHRLRAGRCRRFCPQRPGPAQCAARHRPFWRRTAYHPHPPRPAPALGSPDSPLRPDHPSPGARCRMDRPLHYLPEPDPRRPAGRRPHPLRHLSPRYTRFPPSFFPSYSSLPEPSSG